MIRVALVDDHAMIRRGLRELFTDSGYFRVVGEAGDYAEWREMSDETGYDLLVLDLHMPGRGGIEIIQKAVEVNPRAKILVFSQYPEDQYGMRAFRAGAMGYLNKGAPSEDIILAAQTVANGRNFATPQMSSLMVDSLKKPGACAPHEILSPREMQTMISYARGAKLADIADDLGLSTKTVSVYRGRVKEKLGVTTNAGIAAYALRHGLID
ncbi:MAG: response regulator transcription factor [Burkholderiaceae bacterium]